MRRLTLLAVAALLISIAYLKSPFLQSITTRLTGHSERLEDIRPRVVPKLTAALATQGLTLGSPAFIRIFKEERQLEIWVQADAQFELFKIYEICNFSGELGPKLKEGDRQSPEGFYLVNQSAMNPNSSYHLSFNLGFPNDFDQANARTGSYLMVHGNCVSIGCYAMTDAGIEEIYLIVEAAQNGGQESVGVHAFPFRMTAERLNLDQQHPWLAFWENLKQGYDLFERDRVPPRFKVSGQDYVFEAG